MIKFYRLHEVLRARCLGKTLHYDHIAQGLFPHGVLIGRRIKAWPQQEVEKMNAARVAGKTDEEIRLLVRQLEAAHRA